ncbi:MAG TPA: hypothetical protein V6C91_00195 [Coleofasciculaceae cyanobacterium]
MNWSKGLGVFLTALMVLVPIMNPTEANNNTTPCTPSIEPAIAVTVSDAQTGASLEATVIVKDGNFQEQLSLRGVTANGQIIYGGALERPGVYTVITLTEGYVTSILNNIKVPKDRCHVVTQKLKITLNPIERK